MISAALAMPLAVPAGAQAATATVRVGDDFFQPGVAQIAPGDQVSWVWEGQNQHTVTTYPDQSESFDSGTRTSGTFSRVFTRRGRFRYFCEVHPLTMRGAVEVGPAPFPDTSIPSFGRARVVGSPGKARFTFRLSEAATVAIAVRGPSRKSFRRRLGKGRRSVTLRRLRAGRYRAALTATDRAGNKGRAKGRFTVPR